MKRQFDVPEIDVVEFNEEDIVTSSGCTVKTNIGLVVSDEPCGDDCRQ